MVTLQLLFGQRTVERLELGGAVITVGRAEDSDVVVPDATVSRRHCSIMARDDHHLLKDLRSRSGTFVNGMRVSEVKLRPGDEVQLGRHTLVFQPRPVRVPAPKAKARKVDPLSGTVETTPLQLLELRQALLITQRPHVVVMGDQTRELKAVGDGFEVGYHDDAQVRLPGTAVWGKRTLLIAPTPERAPWLAATETQEMVTDYHLEVLAKGAGVKVDGRRVRGQVPLHGGELIEVAGRRFRFRTGTDG